MIVTVHQHAVSFQDVGSDVILSIQESLKDLSALHGNTDGVYRTQYFVSLCYISTKKTDC